MAANRTILVSALSPGFSVAAQSAGYRLAPLESVDPRSLRGDRRPLAILLGLDDYPDDDWPLLERLDGLAPLIGSGASGSLEARLRAAKAGCVRFLDHPADVAPTLALLGKVLDRVGDQPVAETGQVLLVDGDRASAEAACTLLQGAGFEVSCLADTAGLLKALAGRRPDLLLLNLDAPAAEVATIVQVLRRDPCHDGMAISVASAAREKRALATPELIPIVTAEVLASRRLVGAMYRDQITGGYRQSYFQARLDDEIVHSTRQGTTLSLALVKLCGFEAVAYQRGPEAANRLAAELVRTMMVHVRRTDLVCHLGSGRFAVMLPAATSEQAVVLLDMLRMGFAPLRQPFGGEPAALWFAAGVADLRQGRTRDLLLTAATRALQVACDEDGGGITIAEAV
jgi:diguanylate cyclase (GGDEF)-like protein